MRVRKSVFAIFFFAALICLAAPVLAVENETEVAPAVPFEAIYEAFAKVGYAAPVAVLVGLVTSLLGYMSKTSPEAFKLDHFIYTAIISLVIGVATVAGGWNYVIMEQWLANGSLTIWLYWIAKIVAKRLGWNVVSAVAGPPA
jgi:hypothetical protein